MIWEHRVGKRRRHDPAVGGGVMTFKSKIRIWKKLKAEHGHRVLVGCGSNRRGQKPERAAQGHGARRFDPGNSGTAHADRAGRRRKGGLRARCGGPSALS
jgi:hypothetical protein